MIMIWERPDYELINMSAEIGGYQDDFEERHPEPRQDARPVLQQTPETE
jgi:hypothetical protein